MKRASVLMVQGTASTVGKSTLVTGLCRIFAQDGWRVAPFKAQNMALNSYVTKSGGEIGRAQAVQAEAAGVEPTVDMNPILLKPEGNSRSQVIVMGRPLATLEAVEYYRNRSSLLGIVEQALERLRAAYDLIIIEGAGSPVELNLTNRDLVNMQIARLTDAPVLLVGDIDRGGIFASLLGTLMLLAPEDRERVKGLIVNKFRGDKNLWLDGEQMLAERSGVPVLGTIPMFKHIRIAEEDSVALDDGSSHIMTMGSHKTESMLEIVVVRLPYLSNYDEFDPLAADPRVHLRFASHASEFPEQSDLIILPGTKSTLADLAWLWRQGLVQHIRQSVQKGSAVLGICGGYQMLGERVYDEVGAESIAGTAEPGLNLFPGATAFEPMSEKITIQCEARVVPSSRRGLFTHLNDHHLHAYQIHMGRTALLNGNDTQSTTAFQVDTTDMDGWLSPDGWCAGCYLHGLFENDGFLQAIVTSLSERRSKHFVTPTKSVSFSRSAEYDKLAEILRTHLDLQQLKTLCNLTE
ncbi:MAG: cobyric acid synthase [Ktedonobacteraceae bacterium]